MQGRLVEIVAGDGEINPVNLGDIRHCSLVGLSPSLHSTLQMHPQKLPCRGTSVHGQWRSNAFSISKSLLRSISVTLAFLSNEVVHSHFRTSSLYAFHAATSELNFLTTHSMSLLSFCSKEAASSFGNAGRRTLLQLGAEKLQETEGLDNKFWVLVGDFSANSASNEPRKKRCKQSVHLPGVKMR